MYASALADRLCANLIAVHVIPPVRGRALSHSSEIHFEAHARLEDVLQRLNISAEIVTPTGFVEDSLCAAANRLNAELLVVGRAANSETGFSLACRLARSAPCPVVSSPRPVPSTDCFWTEWQQDDSEQSSDARLYATA
jgi:nucleotide-binding universal stress UspA family protein